MPSDTDKAALDFVAESLDLSPEQVKPKLRVRVSIAGEGRGLWRRGGVGGGRGGVEGGWWSREVLVVGGEEGAKGWWWAGEVAAGLVSRVSITFGRCAYPCMAVVV